MMPYIHTLRVAMSKYIYVDKMFQQACQSFGNRSVVARCAVPAIG